MRIGMQALTAIPLWGFLVFPSAHAAGAPAMAADPGRQGQVAVDHSGHGEHGGAAEKDWPAKNKHASWTAFPTLKTRVSGDNRERRVITVVPQNIAADSIDAWSSDVRDAKGRRQLALDLAGARLDKPAAGGFHWLAARQEQEGTVLVASTVYYFSDRGGKNPTAMFMRQKHELEILPQPFPREHSRYRANEDWKFLVHFNGKPLASQKVILETTNGTKTELLSDPTGVVAVRMPDDFKAEAEQKPAGRHDHGRRMSDFVLATEHADGGKIYLTAFNSSYARDAFDQRNLAVGLGFTLLGMIGAVPLLRQRKPERADAKRAAAETTGEEA